MKKLLFILLVFSGLIFWSLGQKGNQINIFLAGNSTMADKPYGDGNPEKGWGQVFPLYFKSGVKIENLAVNGRSTKSFINEGHWDKLISKVDNGDFVIIEFGHNDAKSEDPKRYAAAQTDFSQNLRKFVSDVRKKGAIPILATPIVRRKFDEDGRFYDTHYDYPESVRKVADEEKVVLFDLHYHSQQMVEQYGPEKSKNLFLYIDTIEYSNLTSPIYDDTHLSAYGSFKICDYVAKEIRTKLPELGRFLKK